MADVDYEPDPLLFPSQAWFAAYEEEINGDEEYADVSEGWGVDFNGHFVFEMTEMPVDELDVEAMPDYLQEELDTYLDETDDRGYVGHAFCGLEDGKCTGAYLVESPGEVDEGFLLSATTENWKALLEQEMGVIDGLMGGDFELDGDMQKILQYSDAAVKLTELAGEPDHEFADEKYAN
ncbi:sterol carrier protein [Halococcus morrhuae DSM 1307]|uniref:Sterol carrier protein n=1 Tax=Halococcus morrhuae DSM 1307 TaxID=931277 RepID=M0M4B4_HALMO|nr:SCP2 sterol-binding domain-containing protein [Halococcus morrhuae]EMA39464.1 sterol carrier protein [Halococcus morrhuae DSM 1307]